MKRWKDFRPCPHCSYDFATGDGERACSWGACPYLPEELDVFCENRRFDFLTMEGNPPCSDPVSCEHGVERRSHVANVLEWRKALGLAVP